MRKKASTFLMNETMGIILAVAAVLVLVFAGVKLYNVFVDQEVRNAQKLIDEIEAKINLMEDGDSNEFIFRGVDGWNLHAWSKKAFEENPEPGKIKVGQYFGLNEDKPESCFFDSCICVCKGDCQDNGFCRNFDVDEFVLGPELRYVTFVKSLAPLVPSSQEPGFDVIGPAGNVHLRDDLFSLVIEKQRDGIRAHSSGNEKTCLVIWLTNDRKSVYQYGGRTTLDKCGW